MALRRPAAHLRRAPGWRRSGDESCWESLISEDVLTPVAHLPRAPRPQSAIEGGQLDDWLEHLPGLQSNLLTAAVHGHLQGFNNRTTSVPAFNKEATGHSWRHPGIPAFSRRSSSCGSSTQCESPLGSRESLQTGPLSSEARGSWERAHIVQAARKEQPQLSCLGQVKTGWLPIQRRVTMVSDQALDPSVGQVKLKQPITPIFQTTREKSKAQDGDEQRCHAGQSFSGVKTWQPPDPIGEQRPEKQRSPAKESDRPVRWQVLRRGWNTNRVCAFPGGTQSTETPTGTSSDPNRKPPLMKTTSLEPVNRAPLHQTASLRPWRQHTQLQGPSSTDTLESQTAFNRKSSVQPVRATAPLCTTNRSPQPSRIQTSSAVTTLIPQHKAGFSSITISSRKVSRSASLPGSSSQSSGSSSPPQARQPVDPNSRQVTVRHNATIVKVKEQRVTCCPAPSATAEGSPAGGQGVDTVVHRRKATIIKVTERRESYRSAEGERRTRPEYRHSYTEGVYEDSSTWSHCRHNAGPLHHHPGSTERLDPAVAPRTSTADSDNGGTLHRSTLRLLLSNPPPKAAPTPSEDPPEAVGQRWDRLRRPLSWYGNGVGHTEPRQENVTPADARKLSFGLPQDTSINPVNSGRSFISSGTEAGQLVDKAEDPERRASPCLTLIKAPDPHSHQTPEEVLALNAAAIIANIKLQRQLSKKKTQNGSSEDSTASPQGSAVADERECPDQSHSLPPAGFISVSLEPEGSPGTISLQEALQRSRPHFITRSQGRVRELQRRTQERREMANVTDPQAGAAVRQKRTHGGRSTSLEDNLLNPSDGAITGREMRLRSKRPLKEATRKRVEEQKREVFSSNCQKVALFKKKLLDHILPRSNS